MANFEVPKDVLHTFTEGNRSCIERLRNHEGEVVDLSGYPISKRAAVLVLLYEIAGQLRVLLTTRSKTLRSHPGQTALPGGKVDDTDRSVVETAYREAHEEVGLPLDCPDVHTICILRPFIASSKILVTPIVALLTDTSVLKNLKACEGEVDCIFDHPLEAILDPYLSAKEPLVEKGTEHWQYEPDYHSFSDVQVSWLNNAPYRMHRFRTSASPIKGLTSEILIATATVAYARSPTYLHYIAGQYTRMNDILRVLASMSESIPKVNVGAHVPTEIPVVSA